ncbi:calumenin-A-like isoform X4 [Stylophora pistillata]|uniref:calumenin-A-like isoform X4 n=1 Tax=Stylophora pistillata TaxID=50429 RepID=UPI000C043892|nr:calumenin-A-like isoform X4 [Stylophora pistillata]
MALSLLFFVTYVLCTRITAEFRGPETSVNPEDDGSDDKEKAKLRSVLSLIDRNGDSNISVKELSAWTQKSMRTFYRQEADGFTEKQERRDSKRFEHADVNRDGLLSRDELISLFHPEESANMFGVIVEEFMEYMDSDNDGLLSFREYKGKTADTGNTDEHSAKESFKRLDKDSDGKLNKEEMKLWLEAVNTSAQANNQAQRQVQLADDNKDGFLSKKEIMNHMEIFTAGPEGFKTQQKVKDEL